MTRKELEQSLRDGATVCKALSEERDDLKERLRQSGVICNNNERANCALQNEVNDCKRQLTDAKEVIYRIAKERHRV